MKLFKKLLLVLIVPLLLCGCAGTKESKDPSEIQSILEEAKFDVYDSTEQVGYASRALYGIKGEAKANYVKGDKKYDIQGIFLDECKNVYSVCGNDYKKDDNVGDNWTNLTVTNKETYYYVGWVGDSYITIVAPISYQSEMEAMIGKLGF